MAVPGYQNYMLPLLRLAADEKPHSMAEAFDAIALQFKLTPEDRSEVLPSGRQKKFENRVGWARTYLKKAGLLEAPERT
ncbi:MAG: winged helix-turn-helix domain-containing protein, partial [Chloroflexi bacterium]|nr:winged helix-turn-helix domain-containing protein [Chloroflexota bacterium]